MTEEILSKTIGHVTLTALRGNIVEAATDAIVNAANSRLAGGGGVDGAIHAAAGSELYELTARHGHCPTGSAVLTAAAMLNPPTRFIIHAVGPVYRSAEDQQCEKLLTSAYHRCMELADEAGARSIAFPAISTGVYGYPIRKAAPIAINAVAQYLQNHPVESLELVKFVLFSESDRQVYQEFLSQID